MKPEGPAWTEISIDVDPVAQDALASYLFDLGSSGTVTEGRRTLKAYFRVRGDSEETWSRICLFLDHLARIFPDIAPPALIRREIGDQDWDRAWRHFFRVERVTPSLLIVPAWEPVPPDFKGHVILMDPGPAFGTGQHPTTRMCLESLEAVSTAQSWSLLDVGTGSGILAIHAAKLGAGPILAIDIDPVALGWAGRNAGLNGLGGCIEFSSEPLSRQSGTFSVAVANLFLKEILELRPSLEAHLDPGGWLILSGILREQVPALSGALTGTGLRHSGTRFQKEWACMVYRKEGPDCDASWSIS